MEDGGGSGSREEKSGRLYSQAQGGCGDGLGTKLKLIQV
jgi:hypothetical protein